VKRPSAAQLALGGATLVAVGAIAGSASSLYAIATRAQMSAPWSLPVSLDVLALVAAIAVRARRRDRLAWFALTTATALSTALQIVDAPADLLARISHGAPPIAALIAFELALRASNTQPAPTAPTTTHTATGTPPPPESTWMQIASAPNTNGKPPRTTNGTRKPPPTSRPRPTSARATSPSVDELLPKARLIAERIRTEGLTVTRGRLAAGLRDAGVPIGSTKTDQLLARLRTPEIPPNHPTARTGSEHEQGEQLG
jgi:hypothetical protein